MENSPLKVEVLGREEMEEENSIKPASIASILGDVSGVQIQQSSAVSGNANVRIQGLEGKYTQVLRDGIPLYEGFSGGFGILSIPPLDLKQVELIKGSASTLYGGGAIGGLVNIISRRPSTKRDLSFTLNQSTLKESNINAYSARRSAKSGYTLYSGYTHQGAVDVNKDGFSDVGRSDGFVFHPRLFFYSGPKTTIITGYLFNIEDRIGGDMKAIKSPKSPDLKFYEKNTSFRQNGELIVERKIGEKKMEIKASLSSFDRKYQTGTDDFRGRQLNYFSEASLFVPYGKNNLVAGINALGEYFNRLSAEPLPPYRGVVHFANNTAGVFVQHTLLFNDDVLLEAGLRDDYNNKFGNFFLPRVALFNRFNPHWAMRLGLGAGYKIPNPFSVQIVDYSPGMIDPFGNDVRAEHSMGYNAEINYKTEWGDHNEFFINHAFFLTRINKPVIARETALNTIEFINAPGTIATKGFDTYIQATLHGWELYAGYTYTIAKRNYLSQNQFMPLTPKNRMAFTIVREWGKNWFTGLEGSYTGYQYRLDATKTPGYLFVAALIQRKLGTHINIVLNGENLLDFRQSRKEALFTGPLANPQFVPLWAPIDGIVINLAVRVKLF